MNGNRKRLKDLKEDWRVEFNDTTLKKVCTYVFTVAKVSVCERCAVRLDMYLRKKEVNVIGRNCLSNL
jgi:hypothetical protein